MDQSEANNVQATALTALTNWHVKWNFSLRLFLLLISSCQHLTIMQKLYWHGLLRATLLIKHSQMWFFFSLIFCPSLDDSICWFSSICHPPCIRNTTMACDLSLYQWQLSASLLPPACLSEAVGTNLLCFGVTSVFECRDSVVLQSVKKRDGIRKLTAKLTQSSSKTHLKPKKKSLWGVRPRLHYFSA